MNCKYLSVNATKKFPFICSAVDGEISRGEELIQSSPYHLVNKSKPLVVLHVFPSIQYSFQVACI